MQPEGFFPLIIISLFSLEFCDFKVRLQISVYPFSHFAGEDSATPQSYPLSAWLAGESFAAGGGQGTGEPGKWQCTANFGTAVSHTIYCLKWN